MGALWVYEVVEVIGVVVFAFEVARRRIKDFFWGCGCCFWGGFVRI